MRNIYTRIDIHTYTLIEYIYIYICMYTHTFVYVDRNNMYSYMYIYIAGITKNRRLRGSSGPRADLRPTPPEKKT